MALPRRQQSRMPIIVVNRGMIAESGIIPPGLQYIRDIASFRLSGKPKTVMVEDYSGKKIPVIRVTGLFQEAEKENANGRVYPRNVLGEATKLIQDDISRRAVYGELDHPQDAKIHMDRISHLVTKAWMDGNRLYGEAEILDNQPHGAALRGLFERKCQVGISSRGVGDMEMREAKGKQHYVVLEGYQFVTWDSVAEPSVSGATLTVMENLRKKTAPISEAGRKAAQRGHLLQAADYETMLVEAIHDFFETKPVAPVTRRRRLTYSFGH